MRFVPIKNVEQQAILSVHRARQGFVKARTAQANQIRGLLSEFGIVIPQGIHSIAKRMPDILEEAANSLPGTMRKLLERLNAHLKELGRQVEELELQIKLWHKASEASRKLEAIPGIGPITASAIVATVGNATEFKNSRQLAAWLGWVPKQHSSGGKQILLGISKRGDTYLRTLLIHGARAVIRFAENKAESESWLRKLMARRNKTSPQLPWRTKTLASSGRCWQRAKHTNRITPRQPRLPRPNQFGRMGAYVTIRIVTSLRRKASTDCTGNHEVMARLVGP